VSANGLFTPKTAGIPSYMPAAAKWWLQNADCRVQTTKCRPYVFIIYLLLL